jgi:UDP-N-acetylglucosamine:LPS N-acetylglucosamine transferase
MHEYIAASDVVIGKAGPNLIFESVACRKPFIAISHISGNESGNLGMIKDYNLGWVAENPFTAGKLIKDIIADPGLLQLKQAGLEHMARKCDRGGLFLRERVLEWTHNSQPSGTGL